MKLHVFKRAAEKKSEVNKIRREGNVPAVIYVKEKSAETIMIKGEEFKSILRNMQSGHLPTTIFTLVDEGGQGRRAIIKEIQYNITNYDVTHLDFEELHDSVKVNVKVPIECINTIECEGVKQGGAIRQVIRYLRVNCLPKDIPTVFQVDVKNLNMRDSRRLKDLEIPNTVRALADLNEVAVVIVKR